MSKSIKKLSLKQGDDIEDFYFDATTGVKGYDLYGTDEIVVGKWIDGKPIYRKYFNVDIALQANTWNSSIVNDFNGEQPVKAAAINDTAKHSYEGFDCQFYTDNKVYLKSPQSCNISDLFIWYTKTTDQPDSFEEENVELTSEHKTGETFNGKPVYETWRTFTVPNSNSAVKVGNVTDLNIDTMLEIYGMMNDKTHFISFPDVLASSGSFFGIMVRDFGTTGEYNVYVACAQATATFKNQPIHVRFKYTKK